MIIGIAGKQGAGKDTSAEYLQTKYGYGIYSFADPIYESLLALFPNSVLHLWHNNIGVKSHMELEKYKRQFKETELYDDVYGRDLLQLIGTEVFRTIDVNFWVKLCHTNTCMIKDLVIPDVRYPEEAYYIKNVRGGILIYLVNPNTPEQHNSNHLSESHHKYLQDEANEILYNERGISDLYHMLNSRLKQYINVANT